MNDANKFDSTVLKSLKFLGNNLRTEKFILRAVTQKRKAFQKQEAECRAKIKNLMNKISLELDINSKINQEDSDNTEQ